MIFNWAIAAPDAHAKNYSLLLDGPDVRLAPLYDVISFLPYTSGDPRETRTAMAVGGAYSWRAASGPSAWASTARALGLDAEATIDRATELTRLTPSAVGDAIDGLSVDDRDSRALPPLHRLVKTLSDEALKAF